MNSSIRRLCVAVLLGSLMATVGCDKSSPKKVAPAQPLPNTTDSK
jgi:hypothetical protein